MNKKRVETDSLGPKKIDSTRLWGAQTQRLLENFKIGNEIMPKEIIIALGYQKKAAALTNMKLGLLNKKYGNVGVAIQVNLCRTWADIDHLIKNEVSIRLVKGAYRGDAKESGIPLNQAFCSMAHYLKLQDANSPAIATHDEEILKKINDKFYDYEFLYGIRRDLQKGLLDKGHKVRIYVPFGKNWLPYALRRLKEWKNLKFVVGNILKELYKKNKI